VENPELDQTHSFLDELIRLVKTLRGKNGCPWDKKQTPRDVSVYLIEEVFELADAIQTEHPAQIREELGDVLFHIVFIARMFQERGEFDLSDVAQTITEKMTRRHPHVFGEGNVNSSEEVVENWHKIKLSEKKSTPQQSALDSIPVQLPALIRAYRMSERAANSGFDWAEVDKALENMKQELDGLITILDKQNNAHLSQNFGDLLFILVNIARLARIHPETALAGSNKRFELRFRKMEDMVSKSERIFENMSGREKVLIWEKVKKIVR
jgi:tetrapyrrole methylase family protein/MazG family protein